MFLAALATSTALATPAIAQVAAPAPVRSNIDANGVDLFLGTMNVDGPTLSAGNGTEGLTWRKFTRGTGGWGDTLVGTLSVSGSTVYVSFGSVTNRFTRSGSTYISTEGDGSTLSLSGSTYTYTAADGTVALFTQNYAGVYPYQNITGNLVSVTKPNGASFTYSYDSALYCAASKPSGEGQLCTQHRYAYRIGSVTSSAQYTLRFNYANWSGFDPNTVPDNSTWQDWGNMTSVTMSNGAVSGSSTRSQSFTNSSSGGNSYFNVTDAMGRTTAYRISLQGVAGITSPDGSGEDVTVTYDGSGRVFTVTNASGTTTYTYSDNGNDRTTTVTDQLGHPTAYVFDISKQRMTRMTDAEGDVTVNAYDASGRLTQSTQPEGDYTQYSYDDRGNVDTVTQVSKTPGTPGNIVTSANYPSTCANAATCNQPTSTKDANGNQTDYTYDPNTGEVLTMTAPAPIAGGARPTTTYGYTGVGGVSLVNSITACATAATCTGTVNETKKTISYNGNGLPITVTIAAGDGSVSSTSTLTYNDAGDVVTVDGPAAGAADTTTYRYDDDRELTGVILADPDGAGALERQAARLTYNGRGQVTESEAGTVNGTSDSDWAAFVSNQQRIAIYDNFGRKVRDVLTGGGTTFAVTDASYDAHGRLECTAVRMNRAAWGTATPACTAQSAGDAGPDRITRITGYDALDRVTEVTSAYGQPAASVEKTGYTPNGKTAWVIDGENNKTSYIYDGFDRLATTEYPSPAKGSGTSSTTDTEQLGYDPAGDVTSRRLRDGSVLSYVYDGLNRLAEKVVPDSAGLPASATRDVYYGYDLLGRLTYARFDSTSGEGITNSYDALGRRVATTQVLDGQPQTMGRQYDQAGNLLERTLTGGYALDYSFDVLGRATMMYLGAISSGVNLVGWSYDINGRLATQSSRYGAVDTYGYNNVGWLSSLGLDLGSTGPSASWTYFYNPAGQLDAETRDNDAYAWTGAVTVDRAYAANGLNQYASAGPAAFIYDAKGNLTSDGANAYTYDVENRLIAVSGAHAAALRYDPLGRLYEVSGAAGVTRFVWDGAQIVAERDASGGLLRQYGYRPGDDVPAYQLENGLSSPSLFLHRDRLGSVVAVSSTSASTAVVNTYDEYGIPGAANSGRFQYTGQAWLPELGMSYYKARMYSPTLGRFMQTDPIGYADGLNWYDYVGGDPVNAVDPWGLLCQDGSGGDSEAACAGHGGLIPPDIVVTGSRNDPCGGVSINTQCYSGDNLRAALDALNGNAPNLLDHVQPGDILVLAQKPQNDDQGRPDYCFGGSYQTGDALQSLSSIASKVGLAATFLGAPEVGLPILLVSGAADIAGSYLKDRAAGKTIGLTTALKGAESIAISRVPVAKSVEKEAAATAEGLGMAQDSVLGKLLGKDPCD